MGQGTVPQVREPTPRKWYSIGAPWQPRLGRGLVGDRKHMPSDSVSCAAGGWWSGWRP